MKRFAPIFMLAIVTVAVVALGIEKGLINFALTPSPQATEPAPDSRSPQLRRLASISPIDCCCSAQSGCCCKKTAATPNDPPVSFAENLRSNLMKAEGPTVARASQLLAALDNQEKPKPNETTGTTQAANESGDCDLLPVWNDAPKELRREICKYVSTAEAKACREATIALNESRDRVLRASTPSEEDLKIAANYVSACLGRASSTPLVGAIGNNVAAVYEIDGPASAGALAERLHCSGVFLDKEAKWFVTARHCFMATQSVSADGDVSKQDTPTIQPVLSTLIVRRLNSAHIAFRLAAVENLSAAEREQLHSIFGAIPSVEALINRMTDSQAFVSSADWKVQRDLVILRASPIDATSVPPGADLKVGAARRWEHLNIIGVNPYADVVARFRFPTKTPTPGLFAVMDVTPICAVVMENNACIRHACRTTTGTSGSPAFVVRDQQPMLIGVQSGYDLTNDGGTDGGCPFSAAQNIWNMIATWGQ